MVRRMSAVRLAEEIDARVAEHELDPTKVTLTEFRETLVQALWTDSVEAAARKKDADSNRGKGDETADDAGPLDDDEDREETHPKADQDPDEAPF